MSKDGQFDNPLHSAVNHDIQDSRLANIPSEQQVMFIELMKQAKKEGIEKELRRKYLGN
ncbi:hypothetical protein [Desertibacillus haloalkaliphilus]|uniref:hypothetical protein n=1 Tax=Desertibacillus haloalkaliphilus TaxID=1328930 RepID=UPI001C265A07|nr:hypothetical protein [Desertibacillus haloalkaliphilus]MBU8907634.1 hypothetical protein [Desertibacillus haloalkaliphilus]